MSETLLSTTADVRGLGRHGGHSTGRVPGGAGNVASAIVLLTQLGHQPRKDGKVFFSTLVQDIVERCEWCIFKRTGQRLIEFGPCAADLHIRSSGHESVDVYMVKGNDRDKMDTIRGLNDDLDNDRAVRSMPRGQSTGGIILLKGARDGAKHMREHDSKATL